MFPQLFKLSPPQFILFKLSPIYKQQQKSIRASLGKINTQNQQMLEKVYIEDLEGLKQFSDKQNYEIQYSISNDNKVQCDNRVILYGLCIHLFKCISQQHYGQIENLGLIIETDQRERAIYFMNRASSKYLDWITDEFEANKMMHYMRNLLRNSDVKIMLQFLPDLDFTSTPLHKKGCFILIYFYNEDTKAKIEDFSIRNIIISDQKFKNQLEYLGITISQQKRSASIYGLEASQKINFQIKLPSEKSFKIELSDSSIIEQNEKGKNSQLMQGQNSQTLIIYGQKKEVEKFQCKLLEQIQKIKVKTFQRGDPTFNNFIFAATRIMAENYYKCKMMQRISKDKVQIYYHESIEKIFDQSFMGFNDFKSIKMTPPIKAALNDPMLVNIKSNSPDLMVYDDKDDGDIVIAKNELIQFIQKLAKDKIKQRKEQKQEKNRKIQKGQEEQTKNEKYFTQFISNIEIKQENFSQLTQLCKVFKMQQLLTFKIDVGHYIRISNRVKKVNTVYLIFSSYTELIELQSIIQDEISLKMLERIIQQYKKQWSHRPKTIKSDNGQLTLKLYPATEDMWKNKQKYFSDLLNTIRQDRDVVFKTVVCSLHNFKQILNTVHIDFNIFFVLNQQLPFIECDELFNRQTQQYRVQMGKGQFDYLCVVKSDVLNKEYKSDQNSQKEQKLLVQIMSKNIHEYEIGEYLLNQVDEYNIAYMIAEGIQKMYFFLSIKPTAEFIYMTYFQKLLKVIRDKYGKFYRLEQATFGKDISRSNEASIKSVLQRAFLTGQKYVAISIPFEHIKLATLDNITRLPTGNHHLVRYYMRKFTESERYKLIIKQPCTAQYIIKKFVKHYRIKFDNKELRKQIKQLNLGYGSIKKERERKFICMEADFSICQNLLKKFQLQYENRLKQKK